jgi:hypothetical protein
VKIDLHDTKDSSDNTSEANGGSAWVEVACVALLGGGGAGSGGGGCAAGTAWRGLAASTDELALDHIVGACLGLECGAVGGDITGGLDVECTTVVLESRKSDARHVSVRSFRVCNEKLTS